MTANDYIPMRPGRLVQRRGQVLVITLLAITLLVGLIFYVYNVGMVVNRRLEMQNAADAVAISGANWMARSMNVVAVNNITQARLLALVAVMDALPVAAEMTIVEEDRENAGEGTLRGGLEAQLARGVPHSSIERGDFLRNGLERILREMQRADETQIQALRALDASFDSDDERQREGGYPIARATHYRHGGGGSAPQGELWRGIFALGNMSEATALSAGELAQANAIRFGRDNNAQLAFMVPADPHLPAKLGSFDDFGVVLMDRLRVGSYEARLHRSNLVNRLRSSRDVLVAVENLGVRGGAIPDFEYPHRLGPFARRYRWRHGYHVGGSSDRIGDSQYNRAGPAGHGGGELAGYVTFGPFDWALRQITHRFGLTGAHGGQADTSRFSHHLRRVATLKLAYMFGLDAPQEIQYAQYWITDYNEAKQFNEDNPGQILRTQYYWAAVNSTVSWDSPLWLREGSQFYGNITPLDNPPAAMWTWPATRVNRWWDIETRRIAPDARLAQRIADRGPVPRGRRFINDRWQVTSELRNIRWERAGDYVWRVKMELGVDQDVRLGLQRQFDAEGNVILHTVYSVGWYVFRGAEVRDPVLITNPTNWLAGDPRPRPILLDTSEGDYDPYAYPLDPDQGWRRENYMFLGVARHSDEANAWPQQFRSANPAGHMLTVAQAKLFNNSSWDLWTADWQVQLAPVTGWAEWTDRLAHDLGDYDRDDDLLTVEQVEEALEQMDSLPADFMDAQLCH
jgi:hypothetical protein